MTAKNTEIRVELGQIDQDALLDFADFLVRMIAEKLITEVREE